MKNSQSNLSNRIINHLKYRDNHCDKLDNIIIAMYDTEMKNLSNQIVESIADLMRDGIIVEDKKNDDKTIYKLKISNIV